MKNLNNKNVIITGGAAGIGRKMAEHLARHRANLVLIDIDKTRLAETEHELRPLGTRIKIYPCDVARKTEIEKISHQIKADFAFIDILINNAGVVTGKSFLDTHDAVLDRNLAVNLMAVIWMTKQFLPAMAAKNSGHIVNIASATGLIGVSGLVDYCAAKFALVGFSDALRLEMKKYGYNGVKVACICPSFIRTGMFAGAKPPLFSPWLDPDTVAKKIVRAIQKERPYLITPFIVKLLPFFKGLPAPLFDKLVRMTGLDRTMEMFTGRKHS